MELEIIDRPTSGVAAATLLLLGALVAGCSREAPSPPPASDRPAANPERNAYFGDVHVHTGWSFDAFTNGSRATPTDAYAWAQGQEITNSGVGGKIQIQTPLDFYMVAEHAEFMGVFNQMSNPESPLSKTELAKGVNSPDPVVRMQTFAGVPRDMSAGRVDPMLTDPVLARSVWAEENTRESIFDAMQRRETFGTSGTMIKVRFFGGWDFTDADLSGTGAVRAGYARGVPMGSDLKAAAGKVPPVGATVDAATAQYTNTIGAAELATVWTDPDFDPAERAWTSPIWYTPAG